MVTIGLIGGHQIGNITVDEKFTCIRAKNCSDMNAAITTGNHHGTRMLAHIGKMPEPGFIFLKFCRFPAKITLCQICGKLRCRHVSLLRSGFAICPTKIVKPGRENNGSDR